MKKKTANDKYYRNKADELFMKPFRGLPCEVCGKSSGTVGHHNVNKARSKALRYDIKNITILCPSCHVFGNKLCAHSKNIFAVESYLQWFEWTRPQQYKYCKENQYIQRKYSYKQALENMQNMKEAWHV